MQQLPPGFEIDAAPSQPAPTPGIIRGAPPRVDPGEEQRLAFDAERLRLQQQKAQQDAVEFEQKQEKLSAGIPRGMDDIRAEMENVISKAGQARRKSNDWFATGFGSDVAGSFAGTSTRDVQALLDTIGGNISFDRLSRMRAESPTGGALGNVTERELQLLQSTISSLDKGQSDEQFRASMDNVIEAYARVLKKLPGSEPNSILQASLERGADEGEILALARGLDLDVDRDALAANISSRDGGGPTNSFVPPDDSGGSDGGLTLETIGQGLAQGAGNVVQGIGDTVGMITDPIARGLADAFGYDGGQLPSLGTATREAAGLPQSAPGISRSAQEFAGGALFGGAAARGLGAIANPGTAQNVLQTLGRTPVRDTVAGAGAGAGASIGEDIGGAPGAVAGALAGGIGGYAAANRAVQSAAPSVPNALASAAQRQSVDVLPADTGGPISRAVTTGTRASPISVQPVVNAAERQQQQFGDAVKRTASGSGEVLDTQQAGEAVRKGAKSFVEKTRDRGNRLYERAERQAKGVSRVRAPRTIEAIDEALARLKENPAAESGAISRLEAFRAGIENGAPIQGLRDARSTLSQGVYDGSMRSGAEQAMWKGILSNVADDIDTGLRSVGREDAANTFRAADKLWSERIEVIDQVLQPIIGREGAKGGEQILQTLESAARGQAGGNVRLSRILGAMGADEAGNVRATIVDRIGRATPGAQDAQGEAFSAATFLTNWNKLTPQAKTSLFPDKSMRSNLADLARIAEGTKRGQSMANSSNTGIAIGANAAAGSVGAVTNLPMTLLGAGSIYATGRLMASPKFASLLARTAKMPPEAANRTLREQLGVLATKEPLLQNDINGLLQAVNDNGRLAADENQAQN